MPTSDDGYEALRQRVEQWSARLSVPVPRVRVRDMSRKWGSCSTIGTITLATDLVNQDVGFQDFVIAHELLHLRVPNHGKLFKVFMTAHVPDWRALDIMK
ncbi:MAG: M48 family metallopeptidase [Dehalococcoidia bacterium]|nr:M48 family metallopeptidase [Dehalococcoidia bacterium]